MPPSTTTHVNDSIQPMTPTTWLIGSRLLLTHHPVASHPLTPNPEHLLASWSDDNNGLFTLSSFPPNSPTP